MKRLANKLTKEEALALVEKEGFERQTISFYRYVHIENPTEFRDMLYKAWSALGVLGRVYVAEEGINAQISVPVHNVDAFRSQLESTAELKDMPFKLGLSEQAISFWKLTIKVKRQIVADDLPFGTYDISDVGKHLSAKEWNEAMSQDGTIVIDMRNGYESDIGKFDGAVAPDCLTFREELPMVLDEFKEKKENKILLYCTGGVRCEKTSAFLKHHGFKDVNQLHGGIIDYVRQVKEEGLENKFKGKNFVFDARRDEKISEDVLAECYQCGSPADTYIDCENQGCHVLFIQCDACAEKMNKTCSEECKAIVALPKEKQKELRRGKKANFAVLRRNKTTA